MNLTIIKFMLFINLFSFAQRNDDRIFKQEINLEMAKILYNGDEWIFVKEIYSDNKISQEKTIFIDEFQVDSLLKKYSYTEKLKYKYFECKKYIFTKNIGLKYKESFICKAEYISKYNVPTFKSFNYEIFFESDFTCETKDLIYENIVCVFNIGKGKLTIEFDQNYFYSTIFDNNCNLIERIKIKNNDFNYLKTKGSFFLKSEDYLIVYSEGKSLRKWE